MRQKAPCVYCGSFGCPASRLFVRVVFRERDRDTDWYVKHGFSHGVVSRLAVSQPRGMMAFERRMIYDSCMGPKKALVSV